MTKTIKIVTLFTLIILTACERGEVPFPEACVENKPKRDAALKAKDWNALEVAAVKFIEGCDKAYGDEELAKAHAELSLVLRSRKDFKNAAEFAARGVFWSKEPDYHIEKAISLVELKRREEAGLELDVAELMTKLALKNNELRKIAWEPREAPDYIKKKQNYENLLKTVTETRKQLELPAEVISGLQPGGGSSLR
jgi:hypothetical protein